MVCLGTAHTASAHTLSTDWKEQQHTMKQWLRAGLASLALLVLSSPLADAAYYARTSTVLNGSTNVVAVPFPYLQQSDVQVSVNGVGTAVTWPSSSTVQLPGSAASYNGKTVTVVRTTSIANPDVVFAQGALNPLDLNTMSLQSLYTEQEIYDLIGATNAAVLSSSPQITGGLTFTTKGSTQVLATASGAVSNNDIAVWDSNGNLVDSGVPVGTNSGILGGTVGQIAIFNSAGVAVQGTSILPAGTGAITQGVGDASNLVATDQFVLNNATAAGRNLLLNGEFSVSQWAATSLAGTTTFTGHEQFVSDRWEYDNTTGAALTYASRLGGVVPPAGYAHNFGFSVNTVHSTLGSSDDIHLQQVVEAGNFLRSGFGTAAAQPLSLSFWIRASVTGNYGGSLCNAGVTRCYTFAYAITAPNTWTFVGVTIPADVTGTWALTGNGVGITVFFSLGAGSSNVAATGSWGSGYAAGAPGEVNLEATNGATWYMTGAQLELSNLPTAFEHVPPYQMLLQCQRYAYYVQNAVVGIASSSSALYSPLALPNTMRGGAAITSASASNRAAPAYTASTGSVGTPNIGGFGAGLNNALFTNGASNWTTGAVIMFTGMIDAELF